MLSFILGAQGGLSDCMETEEKDYEETLFYFTSYFLGMTKTLLSSESLTLFESISYASNVDFGTAFGALTAREFR